MRDFYCYYGERWYATPGYWAVVAGWPLLFADGLEHASYEAVGGQRIVETVFAAADRLVPARPANLHLLLEIAARVGATSGMPEPPDAITRIAAAKGSTRLAAAARQISPRH